ncbi:MAG: aldo/keto reductase [Flavobacteriaceae bacterium]
MNSFSKIIAGTMTWGLWGQRLDTQAMGRLIHQVIDTGITSFDHADLYGDYTNETDFGRAWSQTGIPRDQVQLISKCGIAHVCPQRPFEVKHYNYSQEYIVSACEATLKALQTDYLDLYLLHRPSPLLDPEQVVAAVDTLLQSGKIKSFGLSNFTPPQVDLIQKYCGVSANQIEISLTMRDALYNGQLDQCLKDQITPMAWSPLGDLVRSNAVIPDALTRALEEVAAARGLTTAQIALAWLAKHPAGIVPVVGSTRPERLAQAMEAMETTLTLTEWFTLTEAATGKPCP